MTKTNNTPTVSIFDLIPKNVEEPVRMHIYDKNTGEETGLYIDTLGKDSKKWKRIQLERTHKMINKQTRKNKKSQEMSLEEVESLLKTNKEDYAQLITGWELGDANLAFSETTLKMLLSDSKFDGLFDAHIEFVEDRANFF